MRLKQKKMTETQLVSKIQDRYKISHRSARQLAHETVQHLRYVKAWSSNRDVWERLLADELQGGELVELLYLQQLIKENKALNSSYYRTMNLDVTS